MPKMKYWLLIFLVFSLLGCFSSDKSKSAQKGGTQDLSVANFNGTSRDFRPGFYWPCGQTVADCQQLPSSKKVGGCFRFIFQPNGAGTVSANTRGRCAIDGFSWTADGPAARFKITVSCDEIPPGKIRFEPVKNARNIYRIDHELYSGCLYSPLPVTEMDALQKKTLDNWQKKLASK